MTGRYHVHMRELHDRYGPIVRIGPNLLDIAMPEVIKTVYGSDTNWRKVAIEQVPSPRRMLIGGPDRILSKSQSLLQRENYLYDIQRTGSCESRSSKAADREVL